MRRTELALLASLFLSVQFFPPLSTRAQEAKDKSAVSQASVPRESAEKYAAHAEQDGVSVGAERLTRKQVAKEFVAEVNRCCLVVQVAVYPKKDGTFELSLDDFALVVDGSDVPVRPEKVTVIAAKLEKKNNSNGNVTTAVGVGVGYDSGTYTDPNTGQPTKSHGVYTTTSVGVGVGSSVPPAGADRGRDAIARELGEKSLPEAKITVPVAGYLYFSISKPRKDAKYSLECSLKNGTLILPLP
jgi:hypothetical protein